MSQKNQDLWAKTILEDEFNDVSQNKRRGDRTVSGASALKVLEDLGSFGGFSLDVGCGHGTDRFDYLLDPSPKRAKPNPKVRQGWLEDLPFENDRLGYILCWGTFCFVRSQVDSMMEINRCLKVGGVLIFDIVTYTTMPLAQTQNRESFLRWCCLFGFEVQGWCNFGNPWHQRTGIRLIKTRPFDARHFRMVQAQGKINNKLDSRDWYLE